MPKPKELSEAERRERAELRAANKAAREEKAREAAEAEAQQTAKNCHDNIWKQFRTDLNKGKDYANKQLLLNLTDFAGELVPFVMTAKEYSTMVLELTDELTAENAGNDTPLELVEKWLNGSLDLSRIKLEDVPAVSPTGNLDGFSEEEEEQADSQVAAS